MPSQLSIGLDYESNPYPPTVPGVVGSLSPDLYQFLGGIIRSLRKQHNVTQAGDTTFSWNDLTKIGNIALYDLGSLGRFLHPNYGIVTARYVQFNTPLAGVWTGSPVGFKNTGQNFNWQATTDFSKSNAKAALGLMASYTLPLDGQYGWVLVSGINLQSVVFAGAGAPTFGAELVWSADEHLGSGAGRVLGIVINTTDIVNVGTNLWELPPASILLRVI